MIRGIIYTIKYALAQPLSFSPGEPRLDLHVHWPAIAPSTRQRLYPEELVVAAGVGGPRVQVGPAAAAARVHHHRVVRVVVMWVVLVVSLPLPVVP